MMRCLWKLVFLVILLHVSSFLSADNQGEIKEMLLEGNRNKAWVDNMNKALETNLDISGFDFKMYSKTLLKTADSLKYKKGSIEANIQLSYYFQRKGQYDSSIIVLNDLMYRNKSLLENAEFSNYWLCRGLTYYEQGKFDSALINYNHAIKILPKMDEVNSSSVSIYLNRANVYSMQGLYGDAIAEYLRAASYYEKNDKQRSLATTYDIIGTEISNLKEYKRSIDYYKKAIEINKQIKNSSGLAQNYANIGASYKELDSLDVAISYYEKSLEIATNENRPRFIAQSMLNLGNIYEKKGNYDQAIANFKASLKLCEASGMDYGSMLNYLNLGHSNWLKGTYNESQVYYFKALEMTRKMKLPKEESQVLDRLSSLNEAMGNYKEAYKNQKLYSSIKDSLLTLEQSKYILNLEKKYESHRQELVIVNLEKKALVQKLIIGGLFVSALILFFLFIRNSLLQKIAINDKLLVEEKSKNMEAIVNTKNKELKGLASQLVMMQSNLNVAKKKIEDILPKIHINPELEKKHILNVLNGNTIESVFLDEFETRLERDNHEFYRKLLNENPKLSPTELKVCALLRLNLATKEIAQITHRSPRTIDFTRNSIRKKLDLSKDQNIVSFLISIN